MLTVTVGAAASTELIAFRVCTWPSSSEFIIWKVFYINCSQGESLIVAVYGGPDGTRVSISTVPLLMPGVVGRGTKVMS